MGETLNYVSPESSKENQSQSCNSNASNNNNNNSVIHKSKQEFADTPCIETNEKQKHNTTNEVIGYQIGDHEVKNTTDTPPSNEDGQYSNVVSVTGLHASSTGTNLKMEDASASSKTSSPTGKAQQIPATDSGTAYHQPSYHSTSSSHYDHSSHWNSNNGTNQGNGGGPTTNTIQPGGNHPAYHEPTPPSGRAPPISHSTSSASGGGIPPSQPSFAHPEPSYYDYNSQQHHHVPTQYPNETLSSLTSHESGGPPPMNVSYPPSSSSGQLHHQQQRHHHDYHNHQQPPLPHAHPMTTAYGAPPAPVYHPQHQPPATVVYANGAYYHHYMVPPPPPIEYIRTIKSNDVLCGRGGATNSHPGNRSFRVLVKKYQDRYLKAKKRDKPSVASMVVDLIRDKGGRFLRRCDSLPGGNGDILWVDIGDERAREKTCQALREGAPERRRNGGSNEGNKSSSDEDEVRDEKRKRMVITTGDETEETASNSSSSRESSHKNPILGTTVAICKPSTADDNVRFRDSYLMREEVYCEGSDGRGDEYVDKERDFVLRPLTRFTKPFMTEMDTASDLTTAEKEMYLKDFLPPMPSLRTTQRKRKHAHVRVTHEDSYHSNDHHSVDPEYWGRVASV